VTHIFASLSWSRQARHGWALCAGPFLARASHPRTFSEHSSSRRAAALAGVPPAAVRRSRRLGDDLPAFFLEAIKATEATGTARHQAGRRENPTRCWLEQEVREGESLYVSIVKM